LARSHEQKSVRTDRYKYIVTIDEQTVKRRGREYLPPLAQREELYDLSSDPWERHDLLSVAGTGSEHEAAGRFYDLLLEYLTGEHGQAEPTTLSEEAIEKLKGLGYVGN
jgi:hypothetical protein